MQKKTRKQYSAEFKAKVVKEMLREEKTVGQLAAEYGGHSNMLYRRRDQALAGLPGLFSNQAAQELAQKEVAWQQEREALYAEIGRLTTQVTWLEKNLAQGLSREERRKLVDWENRELPVSTQASLVKKYNSPREAREGLSSYLRFYNEERLHQALDYATPAEVYFAREAKR